MTTYSAFVTNVAALSITGVKRTYNEPPNRINSADMPCQFPRLPEGDYRPLAHDSTGGAFSAGTGGFWPSLRCELVIIISPIQLDTDVQNFSETIDLMDALTTALRNSTLATGISQWTTRTDTVEIQGTYYHALITEIEAFG